MKTWAQHPRTSTVTAAEKGDGGRGQRKRQKKQNKTTTFASSAALHFFRAARPTDGRLDYRGSLPPRRAACTVTLVFDEMWCFAYYFWHACFHGAWCDHRRAFGPVPSSRLMRWTLGVKPALTPKVKTSKDHSIEVFMLFSILRGQSISATLLKQLLVLLSLDSLNVKPL